MTVCTAQGCGEIVDPAALAGGFTTHPACDLPPAESAARGEERSTYQLLAGVAAADPAGLDAALLIIHSAAQDRGEFTANDIRAMMNARGVAPQVRGPAFATAERKRWIRKIGLAPSTGATAHGKPVHLYRSLLTGATNV